MRYCISVIPAYFETRVSSKSTTSMPSSHATPRKTVLFGNTRYTHSFGVPARLPLYSIMALIITHEPLFYQSNLSITLIEQPKPYRWRTHYQPQKFQIGQQPRQHRHRQFTDPHSSDLRRRAHIQSCLQMAHARFDIHNNHHPKIHRIDADFTDTKNNIGAVNNIIGDGESGSNTIILSKKLASTSPWPLTRSAIASGEWPDGQVRAKLKTFLRRALPRLNKCTIRHRFGLQ
jgi:hypothetical protein